MLRPDWIGTRLIPGKECHGVQSYSQFLVLTVLTGLRNPRLTEDWKHLIGNRKKDKDYSKLREVYEKFKIDLDGLTKKIEKKNEKSRKWPFWSFYPPFCEVSVSV